MELLLLFSYYSGSPKYLSWDFCVFRSPMWPSICCACNYQLASGVSGLKSRSRSLRNQSGKISLSTMCLLKTFPCQPVSPAGFLRRSDGMDWLFDDVPKCECNLDDKKQGQITPDILIKKALYIYIYIYVYIYIYTYMDKEWSGWNSQQATNDFAVAQVSGQLQDLERNRWLDSGTYRVKAGDVMWARG